MGREHRERTPDTAGREPQDSPTGRGREGGDPNDTLQQWERQLRSGGGPGHGLGEEGAPGNPPEPGGGRGLEQRDG